MSSQRMIEVLVCTRKQPDGKSILMDAIYFVEPTYPHAKWRRIRKAAHNGGDEFKQVLTDVWVFD